jgi:uncharacterized membrane protein
MGTSAATVLGGRVDTRTWPIAVGDVVVIAAFLTVGYVFHNGTSAVAAMPVDWLLTLAPFLLGWVVVAPIVGAYSKGARESAKAAVPLALRSWVAAAVIGLGLRATPVFPGGFQLEFAGIILGVGLVSLGVWRWLFFRIA